MVDRCSKTALFGDNQQRKCNMSFFIRAHVRKIQLIRQYDILIIRGQVQSNRCRDPAVALPAV